MKRHRSVLTRLERVKVLQEKNLLDLEQGTVLGLSKVRHLKIRVKKEKAAAPAAGTTESAAQPAAAPSAAAAKAPAKPASSGKQEGHPESKKKA